MTIVKDKPDNLPTGNDVDPTPLAEEIDVAYLSFQAKNVKVEDPPELGDSVTFVVYGKCIEVGDKENEDGEIRPKRVIKVTSAHKPGKRPVTDPAQGSILTIVADKHGSSVGINPDAAAGGDDQ